MSDVRGLPLLSGPPPSPDGANAEIACRRCNKEFNMIFARSRKCNHCGYAYCHSCSDFQALMPRNGSNGYDPVSVCGFCIEYLNISAAGRNNLLLLPMSKLSNYVKAYNINTHHAIEKEEIVNAIIAARGPNGCLSRAQENYYRRYSVPNRASAIPSSTSSRARNFFSRSNPNPPPPPPPRPTPRPSHSFPRPDLGGASQSYGPPPVPPRPPNPNTRPPPRGQGHSFPRHPNSSPQTHSPPTGGSPYMRPGEARSTSHLPNFNNNQADASPRPRTTSATPPAPAPPPPTLDELLNMSAAAIGTLSVHALKDILFINHVPVGGVVLEKSELVDKVIALVTEERRHRERRRMMEEQEEQERQERQRALYEQFQREREARARAEAGHDNESATTPNERQNGEDAETNHGDVHIPSAGSERNEQNNETPVDGDHSESHATSTPVPPATSPKPPSPPLKAPSATHRDGLCVVCQDDEANIAIVDCGHLAMCRDCADLVMASTKECPLCRTRIVTEARLLRIYRT